MDEINTKQYGEKKEIPENVERKTKERTKMYRKRRKNPNASRKRRGKDKRYREKMK